MENGSLLNLNPENLKKFRRAYASASANKRTTFEFDGQEIVTLFAKYVLEMVDDQEASSAQSKLVNPNLN